MQPFGGVPVPSSLYRPNSPSGRPVAATVGAAGVPPTPAAERLEGATSLIVIASVAKQSRAS